MSNLVVYFLNFMAVLVKFLNFLDLFLPVKELLMCVVVYLGWLMGKLVFNKLMQLWEALPFT